MKTNGWHEEKMCEIYERIVLKNGTFVYTQKNE